jgi:hypothetical protein
MKRLLRLRALLEIILRPHDLLRSDFVAFRFRFWIRPKHRTFNPSLDEGSRSKLNI